MYAFYEIAVFSGINESSVIFNFIIAYAIPYGVIYALGMLSKKTSAADDMKISILSFMIFILSSIGILFICNGIQPTQIMKYPPRIYYISYALFISFLLLSIFKRASLKKSWFYWILQQILTLDILVAYIVFKHDSIAFWSNSLDSILFYGSNVLHSFMSCSKQSYWQTRN